MSIHHNELETQQAAYTRIVSRTHEHDYRQISGMHATRKEYQVSKDSQAYLKGLAHTIGGWCSFNALVFTIKVAQGGAGANSVLAWATGASLVFINVADAQVCTHTVGHRGRCGDFVLPRYARCPQ